MSKLYTISTVLEQSKDKEKIISMLDRLSMSGIVDRLKGNCVSAADIVQHLLEFYGVKSKIIECQAFLVKENQEIKDFRFVGFNDIGLSPNTVDTHVIVVTETSPSFLIDASMGHFFPESDQIFIRELPTLSNVDSIGTYIVDDLTITYQYKKNLKLPQLHQKTLIERLRIDKENADKLNGFSRILIVLGLFSLINFTLNVTLLILKMLYP